jgi:hypothetical protein
MLQCEQKYNNTNGGFCYSVWKFRVINYEEVLRKLACILLKERAVEFIFSWDGIYTTEKITSNGHKIQGVRN